MSFRERDFIRWSVEGLEHDLPVGPGDDAAVLPDGTLVAVDTIVEGVHFEPGCELSLVARKALGACLSDLCAMGAVAETVFVAAQLPTGLDGATLARALRHWAAAFGALLAGGDTVSAPVLALSVTATGHCPPGAAPWLRSGARVGDVLAVSGPLGGSRSGRHLRVRPRADLVQALRAADVPVHAALDLSDGLAADLPRLCEASGIGARVQARCIPIHADARAAPDPLGAALGDGEDFELLLALDPAARLPAGLSAVGQVTARGLTLVDLDGGEVAWPRGGHEHVF